MQIFARFKSGGIALLAALVPYYVTQLCAHAHVAPEEYMPMMTIDVWAAFFAVACYRIYRSSKLVPGPGLFVLFVVLAYVALGYVGWRNYSRFFRIPAAPSEQLNVQRELLNVQEELGEMQNEQLNVQEELGEIQSEQLKVQKDLVDAQNAQREKKGDAPPRLPPKHQKRSAQ